MRQYWINFKGEQSGPMSKEQMARLGLDESAYVWHSGLPDWVKISKVPELSDLLAGNVEAPEMPVEEAPELPQLQDVEESMPEMPQQQVVDEQMPEMPLQQEASQFGYAPDGMQYATQQSTPPAMPQQEPPKCPPTNLVWAIITTLLCCCPAGIVGLIFAFLTKKHYREGNYEKAERMSEYGAWAIIFSIILGLICMPITCARFMQ